MPLSLTIEFIFKSPTIIETYINEIPFPFEGPHLHTPFVRCCAQDDPQTLGGSMKIANEHCAAPARKADGASINYLCYQQICNNNAEYWADGRYVGAVKPNFN